MNQYKKLLDNLNSNRIYDYIRSLDDNEELEKLIPQVKDMKLIGECKYHKVNVYEHSLNALEELESILDKENFFESHLKDKVISYLDTKIEDNLTNLDILKLGIFLHDIGKPASKTTDENQRVHFRGHEIVGEDISFELGNKFGLSKESIDLLCKLVRHHMVLLIFYKTNDIPKEKLFEIFNTLDDDIISLMILGYVDIVSTRRLLNPTEDMNIIKSYMNYILTVYFYGYKKINN